MAGGHPFLLLTNTLYYFIGKFPMAEDLLCHGELLGRLLHVLHEAGLFSPFQLIHEGRIGFSHIFFLSPLFLDHPILFQ
jgi:hypothetical protein